MPTASRYTTSITEKGCPRVQRGSSAFGNVYVTFCKNDDFQLRNASDNVKGTFRTGSSKIDDFERKMLRIAENRRKSMPLFANRLLERVRTCFEIIIFMKNVDGDPRKIV